MTYSYTKQDGYPVLSEVAVDDGQGHIAKSQYEYNDGDKNSDGSFVFSQVTEARPDFTTITTRYTKSGTCAGFPHSIREENGSINSVKSFAWDPKKNIPELKGVYTNYCKGPTILGQTREEFTYDNDHNLTKKISEGTGRNRTESNSKWKKVLIYDEGGDYGWWRPETETISEVDAKTSKPATVRQTSYTYNEKGELKTTAIATQSMSQMAVTEIVSYDNYGNPTHIKDPNGNTTRMEYDPELHLYPSKVTKDTGQMSLDVTTTYYPVELTRFRGHYIF